MCAVTLGRSLLHLLPVPPHFFALAQRNGVEPQRNALMGATTVAVRSHPPLPRTRSPNIPADCVKLTLPGQLTNQPQVNLTHQFVPLWLRAEWERRAGPPSSCGGFKALFFGGSTPFLWASTKEMGSKAGQGKDPRPAYRRTRRRHKGEISPAPAIRPGADMRSGRNRIARRIGRARTLPPRRGRTAPLRRGRWRGPRRRRRGPRGGR